MSLLLRDEAAQARSSRSHSSTVRPPPAASMAMPQPLMPPPMISTSWLGSGCWPAAVTSPMGKPPHMAAGGPASDYCVLAMPGYWPQRLLVLRCAPNVEAGTIHTAQVLTARQQDRFPKGADLLLSAHALGSRRTKVGILIRRSHPRDVCWLITARVAYGWRSPSWQLPGERARLSALHLIFMSPRGPTPELLLCSRRHDHQA